MSVRHLLQTEEAFAEHVAATYGPGTLHPANRLTRCGKRSVVSATTDPADVTCKTCRAAGPFSTPGTAAS